jgi:SAM-dependent methyltransferase
MSVSVRRDSISRERVSFSPEKRKSLITISTHCTWRPPLGGSAATHPRLIEAYDELPLWSAPFGLTLLELVRVRRDMVALDIGSGTGFPLIELAQRLGRESRLFGIDPSSEVLARAQLKLEVWDIPNVTLIQGRAEALPLDDQSVDLILANNGLNNVDDLDQALAECGRVARPGSQLVMTWNLPESMSEIYSVLEALLRSRGRSDATIRIQEHIFGKRKPVEWMRERVGRAGFAVVRVIERSFDWRFATGQALLQHGLWRLAFVPSWLELVMPGERAELLGELEQRLEARAREAGELKVTFPYACLEATRYSVCRSNGTPADNNPGG